MPTHIPVHAAQTALYRLYHCTQETLDQCAPPASPLFFARFVRGNTLYRKILDDIISTPELLSLAQSFAGWLREIPTSTWQPENIQVYLNNQPDKQHAKNYGLDLLYVAYLNNDVSKAYFYDYVLFYCAVISFSGMPLTFKKREQEYTVPPLPKAIKIEMSFYNHSDNAQEYSNYLNYLQACCQVSFSKDCVDEKQSGLRSLLKITLNESDYNILLQTPYHGIWFYLFKEEKYRCIQHQSSTGQIEMIIPGHDLLLTFISLMVATTGNCDVIQPALAFGCVSIETSKKLHEKNFHIASVLDARFDNNPVIAHSRLSSPFEVLLHDLLFHLPTISFVPKPIRELFYDVYDTLPHFSEWYQSRRKVISLDQQCFKLLIKELQSRCVDAGLLDPAHPAPIAAIFNDIFQKTITAIFIEKNIKNAERNLLVNNEELYKTFDQSDGQGIRYALGFFVFFLIEKYHPDTKQIALSASLAFKELIKEQQRIIYNNNQRGTSNIMRDTKQENSTNTDDYRHQSLPQAALTPTVQSNSVEEMLRQQVFQLQQQVFQLQSQQQQAQQAMMQQQQAQQAMMQQQEMMQQWGAAMQQWAMQQQAMQQSVVGIVMTAEQQPFDDNNNQQFFLPQRGQFVAAAAENPYFMSTRMPMD